MSDTDLPGDTPIAQHSPDDGHEPVPSLTGTTVRGIRVAGIGYMTSQAISFGAYLVLARLISPAAFGLYAAGNVITGIGGLFAESGMLAALINRKDRLDEAASTAFVALLISGCLLTLGSVALAPLVGALFNRAGVEQVAAAMSGWLLLRSLTIVPDALLQRRFSFARRVVVDPLGMVAFAAASIPLASVGAGVWALVAGSYASMIVQTASAWWFVRFRPRLREASFSLWREMASFARLVIVSETLRRVAQQIDAFMLGRFAGAAPLGQYRNGLRLADQPASAFVSVTAYVIYPAFARIGHIPHRIAAAARHAYWVALTFAVPVSFASVPLGVPIAVIFLGSRWRPAGHAIAGLCGLVLGTTIVSIASELFKAVGRPGALIGVQLLGFCSIAVTVTVSAILWGVVGVAVAMSFSMCLTAGYALMRVSAVLELSLSGLLSAVVQPAVATMVMISAMLLYAAETHPLSHPELTQLGLVATEVVVGAVAYCLVLALIDPPRRQGALGLLKRLRSRQPIRQVSGRDDVVARH